MTEHEQRRLVNHRLSALHHPAEVTGKVAQPVTIHQPIPKAVITYLEAPQGFPRSGPATGRPPVFSDGQKLPPGAASSRLVARSRALENLPARRCRSPGCAQRQPTPQG